MPEDHNIATKRQISILVREIENYPMLINIRSRGVTKFDKLALQEQWQALAVKLNSVKNGAQKSSKKWQRKWRDLIFNLKKKVKSAKGKANLTELEQRILILGTKTPIVKLENNEHSLDDNSIIVEEDDENENTNASKNNENTKIEVTPHIMTLRNQIRRNHINGHTKKQKVQQFRNGNLSDQIVDGLSRLISLESSSREIEEKQTKLLENMAMNLVKVNVTLDRHAENVNRRLDNLEQRLLKVLQRNS